MESKVDSVYNRDTTLTNPNELSDNKDFISLSEKPNTAYVLKYISNSAKKENQKIIAILSLRNLDFKDYKAFVFSCLYLYEKDVISEYLFYLVLYPTSIGCYWNCELIKNFKDKEFREIIAKNQDHASPLIKETYKLLLSGNLWLIYEDECESR
ncbi:MAG: hypothetical protein ACOYOT_02150 [Bacteroidales bacterium]